MGRRPPTDKRARDKGHNRQGVFFPLQQVSVLEPLVRSWSHFVGIYREKFTESFKNDF